MPLNITADRLDELPEGLRSAAKEVAGKFIVAELPAGFGIEDITGLKRTTAAERDARKAAEGLAKAFLDAGLKPEDAPTASEALSMMRAGKLKNATEIESWKQEVVAKHQAELAKIGGTLEKRTARLKDQLVRGQLAPIIAAKGGSRAIDAILTILEKNIRVEEDANGDLIPVVVGRDGKALLTKKSGSIDPMGFEELVEITREADSTRGLFDKTATGGSGSSSQSGGAGRAAGQDSANLSPRELLNRANARAGA